MSSRQIPFRTTTKRVRISTSTRKKDAREVADTKNAHMAALICCLHPLLDSSGGTTKSAQTKSAAVEKVELTPRMITKFRDR